MKPNKIRVLAIAVFRHAGRILVSKGVDPKTGERFYRPLGGAVEFGERSDQALVREIREEIGQEIADIRLLGILENLFTYDGQLGHEIVFVFDARFVNSGIYERKVIRGHDEMGDVAVDFEAVWVGQGGAADGAPVYPDGLIGLLANSQGAVA